MLKLKELFRFIVSKASNLPPPWHISTDDFEFVEVSVNGQDYPPGMFEEIILPHNNQNCFEFHGISLGVSTIIFASGAIKIVAQSRKELDEVIKSKSAEVGEKDASR